MRFFRGIRDRDFLLWARSKNPENPKIPGIGIFYFGLDRKIPKIPKSLGSGSGFENPEKFQVKNPENPEISDQDLFFRDNSKI